MPDKFNELLLKPDIIELYENGITPNYGYLLNGRFEKDMVKSLYPLKTLSGNPIAWEASETEYLFPIVSLEPKQAGSGDPSPENVRPISGYDSLTVTQSKDEAQVKQITLTLPEIIYGGTVDAVTGVGEKTWETIVLDEYFIANNIFSEYGSDQGKPGFSIVRALNGTYNRTTGFCSHAVVAPNSNPIPDAKSFIWLGVNNNFIYWLDAFAAFGVSSLGDAKNALIAQATAGTPVTIVYQLATPESFQATGNQQLTSFVGYNTMYSNGDSITLKRKARRLEV